MKENLSSPWTSTMRIGAVESISILPFLAFIGRGNPWLEVPLFAAACGLLYALGAWAAPRMVRLLRWAAVVPVLFGIYLLTDAYMAIVASAYMFSRGGKHQGEWQFVYWLGGFLFHLLLLLWIVRTPEVAGYMYLLWGSAFVSVALFLISFQRQLVRDAAVYHKLITSNTLKVGLITVSVLLGTALLVSVLSWVYVGERMVGPLSNFADSFKETLTDNLGPVTDGNLPYPIPENPPAAGEEIMPGNKYMEIVLDVIGGFLVPVIFIGLLGYVIYLSRHDIKAFLFTSAEEKEQESLPFTEEQRSLRLEEDSGASFRTPAISRAEWGSMGYAQKVRAIYRLLVQRWSEKGHEVRPFETPRELGVRMKDAQTARFMDTYSQVKYAEELKEQMTDEELERWYGRLHDSRQP